MTLFAEDLGNINEWLFKAKYGSRFEREAETIQPAVRHMIWPGYNVNDVAYNIHFVHADFEDVFEQISQPISYVAAYDGTSAICMSLEPSYPEDDCTPFYSSEVSLKLFMSDVSKLLDQRSVIYSVTLDFESRDKIVLIPTQHPGTNLLCLERGIPSRRTETADSGEYGSDDDGDDHEYRYEDDEEDGIQ